MENKMKKKISIALIICMFFSMLPSNYMVALADPTAITATIKTFSDTTGTSYGGSSMETALSSVSGSAITSIEVTNGSITEADWAYLAANQTGYTQLTSFTVPNAVTSVAAVSGAVMGSPILPTTLTNVEIVNVSTIGSYAFQGCSNITSAVFAEVTSIGEYAFNGCSGLSVMKLPATPPAVANANAFTGMPAGRRLVFVDEAGTELTGTALTNAQTAYRSVNDGDDTDNLWYGFILADVVPIYTYFKHHVLGGVEVVLGGKYIEVGISKSGSFGTANAPTGLGFHPTYGGVGLNVDGDGFNIGNAPTSGDFFLPGTEEERFTIGYKLNSSTGTVKNYTNAERVLETQITTTTIDATTGSVLSAVTTGSTTENLALTQVITFKTNDKYYKNTITYTNNGSNTLYNVRYMRSFDPDQDVKLHNQYMTYNQVLENFPQDGRAIVRAAGGYTKEAVFFISLDSRARASTFGFANRDPYDSRAYNSDGSLLKAAEVLRDQAIAITFDLGTLAPGESATFEYFTSLDPDYNSGLAAIMSSLGVQINNGAVETNSTTVTLNNSASSAVEMQFSNDNTTWSAWESYSATKVWDITSGNGTKTVYAKYKDNLGNVISSSDSINYLLLVAASGLTINTAKLTVPVSGHNLLTVTGYTAGRTYYRVSTSLPSAPYAGTLRTGTWIELTANGVDLTVNPGNYVEAVVVDADNKVVSWGVGVTVNGVNTTTDPIIETIKADVKIGNTDDNASVIPITRTTREDGTKTDSVIYDKSLAEESILQLKEQGKDLARIVIPDEKNEIVETTVSVPLGTLGVIAENEIALEISTVNAKINIPIESIAIAKSTSTKDLYFNLIPIKEDNKAKVMERAKLEIIFNDAVGESVATVVGTPMTIETNMPSSEVEITLPLSGVTIPENAVERELFLSKLAVYIEHSDGEKEMLRGEIVTFSSGVLGIKFTVKKFSTFTIVTADSLGKKSSGCDIVTVTAPSAAVMNGNEISAAVSSSVKSIIIDVAVSEGATWKLYSDMECTNVITSNKMSLITGSNKAYIKVTAADGKTTQLYPVIIKKLNNVLFIATSDNFADTFAAQILVNQLNGKLIRYGKTDSEIQKTIAYVTKNYDVSDTIYVLGLEKAVSSEVITLLAKKGYSKVLRIGGRNRYATAMMIAQRVNTETISKVLLINGSIEPNDAAIMKKCVENGYQVLFVKENQLTESTISALKDINPKQVYLLGNESYISSEVADEIKTVLGVSTDNIIRVYNSKELVK